ncbi:MAG: hypothetical protein ACF8OB_00925 [Phycisphaeraceae bacterium JB051]
MPIVILSPYSGRPVKIRDKDIGRSVRDEENRIFYVVSRPEGQGDGYYASLTRNGSEKDLKRYDELEEKTVVADEHKREELAQPVHNAMGRKRKGTWARRLIYLAILGGLAYGAWTQKDRFMGSEDDSTPAIEQTTPADTPADTTATPEGNE